LLTQNAAAVIDRRYSKVCLNKDGAGAVSPLTVICISQPRCLS
jgi:hypothetical protein